jgi:hypothetical protein
VLRDAADDTSGNAARATLGDTRAAANVADDDDVGSGTCSPISSRGLTIETGGSHRYGGGNNAADSDTGRIGSIVTPLTVGSLGAPLGGSNARRQAFAFGIHTARVVLVSPTSPFASAQRGAVAPWR